MECYLTVYVQAGNMHFFLERILFQGENLYIMIKKKLPKLLLCHFDSRQNARRQSIITITFFNVHYIKDVPISNKYYCNYSKLSIFSFCQILIMSVDDQFHGCSDMFHD